MDSRIGSDTFNGGQWTHEHSEAEKKVRSMIPGHLDADRLIDNSWLNTVDVPAGEEIACFVATAEMYIDQGCSYFGDLD